MATPSPALSFSPGDFAAALLSEREVIGRARIVAQQVQELVEGVSVAVYTFDEHAEAQWRVRTCQGGSIHESSIGPASILGQLPLTRTSNLISGADLKREYFAQWDLRRHVESFACVPVMLDEVLVGAIEMVTFERFLEQQDVDAVLEITEIAAIAMATAVSEEMDHNASLETVTRLTMLYDMEKVFHSTIQMDDLVPLIAGKTRDLLNVQAVNLWLVQGEELLLMYTAGSDPTVAMGVSLKEGEGAPGMAVDGGDVFVLQQGDERLAARNGEHEGAINSLAASPIVSDGFAVGVLEIVNRNDGKPITDTDVFFLATLCESAGTALHNASLFEAERKVEILQTLVEVSNEITSTLNLDRVLQVIVNQPSKIIPFERSSLALDNYGKVQLKAISGQIEIVHSDKYVRLLREMLEWCSIFDHPVYVVMRGEEIVADDEEMRIKFREYFAETGIRCWYSVPLSDEQGKVGILAYESGNPDFLGETHFEFIKVLASQGTVALRNASLYREVPLIGVLEPIVRSKQKFLRLSKRGRAGTIALAVAVAVFLVVIPLPMRVAGDCSVSPQTMTQVQAEMDGVVHKVYVHEGDPVTRGTVLADMDDWDQRTALAEAEAKRATAIAAMNRALAANDGTEAGMQRVQADYWAAEVGRARERMDHMKLRAPIDGVVSTPHIEDMAGRKLEAGDTFGQIVNTTRAVVDVAVDPTDVPLLTDGDSTAVKLDSFPTHKFRGRVDIISPVSATQGDQTFYFARVEVPNPNGTIRPGMKGLSKVFVGWRPSGYVLFRGIAMWTWSTLWKWFGW